ncbi:zinc-dependent metalloprotease [Terrimonas ferruginea]|uniref:zinc-dependent metalloprotease n=1 Tax=Terrimonas ferruginea TaxID=249 RepID=UPI000424FA9D|nr:zinc-dependent metalloprotease [Terrimonas ferruginea]
MKLIRSSLAAAAILLHLAAAAQQPKADTTRPTGGPPAGRGGAGASQGPKPYKEVITDKAVTDDGLFRVHKVDDKYFFEIPDSVFGRELLVVNRISKSGGGIRNGFFGYAGDQIGQNVVAFDKGPNNKVFLRNISYSEYAKDSLSPMFMSVRNSNIQPIVASFDVKVLPTTITGTVIDITDYVNSDNDILGFNSSFKSALRIGSQQTDKSYIATVRSYPMNVELTTVKTFGRTPAPGAMSSPGGNVTLELNSSWVVLPAKKMQPRYYDPRVSYFAVGYTDFDANPQGVESVRLIKRWRLEPKDGDWEKYKRGELVEPRKPIVFYIDPATPKKWVPYLIQGVNDWAKAFEKAGFKNAIYAREAPTKQEDPEWSLDDARYSAIVYKPSDIANASGPSISDPRTGEIMESHINWYHNVMQLIRNWYFVQASPVDTGARKMLFDDELMGQLIRFVSSHEVGHTLGLPHNYGSSSTVPVEKLRDKAWVEKNGHTPSIMDYARFNYVAQPEDNISRVGLFPRIGDYDDWSIEWGYRLFPQYANEDAEKAHLNQWVINKLKDNRLWFGRENNPDDPRSQREQVGDDAMKGAYYGILNLKRIIPNLEAWTREPNKNYDNLRMMYGEVRNQFAMYMSHVTRYVGGIMETLRTVEEKGVVYEYVPKAKQKEAVTFLQNNLFKTPTWLLDQSIFAKTGISGTATVLSLQESTLNSLLSGRNLGKLVEGETVEGAKAYTISELLNDLQSGIWSELKTRSRIDPYRRNLQKAYVGVLDKLLNPPASTMTLIVGGGGGGRSSGPSAPAIENSDVYSAVRAHLVSLRAEAKNAAAGTADAMSRAHLQDVASRIDNILDPKK